jgi:hypothetical protein
MAAARIAAIALLLISCTALSQKRAMSSITVTITDQTGAVIPGARVWASKEASSSRLEATANASGLAILNLEPGRYGLRVQARAFKTWGEDYVEVETDLRRTVTLAIADDRPLPCTLPCEFEFQIPVEHLQLASEVPLIPMQQLAVPSKRLRSKSHWF